MMFLNEEQRGQVGQAICHIQEAQAILEDIMRGMVEEPGKLVELPTPRDMIIESVVAMDSIIEDLEIART